MRNILLATTVVCGALAGCTDNQQPGPGGGVDLSMSGSSPDLSQSGSNHDLATPPDLASNPPDFAGADLAGVDLSSPPGDMTLLPLCALCSASTDCASGLCVGYMMGAIMRCSNHCHTATASTDCPGINACNGMNYCKCM
jgi:hypothetical protein